MPEVSVAQIVATAVVGLATGGLGYLTALRQAQSKDKEVDRDLATIARQMVDEAVKDLRAEVKELRADRKKDNNNFAKLQRKWTELHSGLVRLRAAFEASDIHLATYIKLAKTNPEQAERYLTNLEEDRADLKEIVRDLCETSEPILDADAAEAADAE